jgi:hypothetical protein
MDDVTADAAYPSKEAYERFLCEVVDAMGSVRAVDRVADPAARSIAEQVSDKYADGERDYDPLGKWTLDSYAESFLKMWRTGWFTPEEQREMYFRWMFRSK